MKKAFLSILLAALSTVIVAQTTKTINMTTAGTLSTLLTNSEKTDVTNLTITGYIDARDVKCMRDEMIQLADIDISNASILAYSGTNGTAGISEKVYPANTMPEYPFCKSSESSQLTNIELPNSIISIGDYAFCLCPNLKSLIFSTNPRLETRVFLCWVSNSSKNAIIKYCFSNKDLNHKRDKSSQEK